MGQAIDKAEWAFYCERISRALEAVDAEVEVESLEIGAQDETEWLPLLGISYDPEDDIIDIALECAEHIITHPQKFQVDGLPGVLRALAITDEDGNRHLLRLHDALALPRPH